MNTIIWDTTVNSIIRLDTFNSSNYPHGEYYYFYKENNVTEHLLRAYPYYPNLFQSGNYKIITYSKVVEVMYDLEPRRP